MNLINTEEKNIVMKLAYRRLTTLRQRVKSRLRLKQIYDKNNHSLMFLLPWYFKKCMILYIPQYLCNSTPDVMVCFIYIINILLMISYTLVLNDFIFFAFSRETVLEPHQFYS